MRGFLEMLECSTDSPPEHHCLMAEEVQVSPVSHSPLLTQITLLELLDYMSEEIPDSPAGLLGAWSHSRGLGGCF